MKDYEQEASFIKGVAMILVIMTHFISPEIRGKMYDLFHIIQAIPVLVFLSAFFLCRKIKNDHSVFKNYFSKSNIQKFILNFVLPAFLISVFHFSAKNPDIKSFLQSGGFLGPGSYYIILYFQIWLCIPFFSWFQQKVPNIWVQSIMCIAIEIIFYALPTAAWLYRLTFIRYFLLINYGVWLQRNSRENTFSQTIRHMFLKSQNSRALWILGLASALILYIHQIYHFPPLPFGPVQWQFHSYLGAGYAILFIFILLQIYRLLESFPPLLLFISIIGQYSLYVYFIHMSLMGLDLSFSRKENLFFCFAVPLYCFIKKNTPPPRINWTRAFIFG